MLKQKNIVIKTANATLTYSEMGDIVCNSANAITITLPTPNSGLWYRINNINNGTITVYYNTTITTLNKNEFCMCYADTTVGWLFSKSGGAVTKEAIESVLTGEITSHSHADNVLTGTITPTTSTVGTIGQFYLDTVIPKLYQCTAINVGVYTWTEVGGGSSGTISQATETVLGGIKAAERTSGETQEVKIDTATGKLYSTPPAAAQNGLPAGGTVGQILAKIDGDNYNAEWIDPPSGGVAGFYAWRFSGTTEVVVGESSNGSLSGTSYAKFTTGLLLGKLIKVSKIYWYVGVANTWTIQLDGEQIGQSITSSGAETLEFELDALVIAAGAHTIALVPATNGRMQYVSNATYIDRWLRLDNWIEYSGYHPPLRFECIASDLVEI